MTASPGNNFDPQFLVTTDDKHPAANTQTLCFHGHIPRLAPVAGACNGGMGSLGAARFLNSVTRPIPVIDFKEAIDAICKPQFPFASHARERNAGESSFLLP